VADDVKDDWKGRAERAEDAYQTSRTVAERLRAERDRLIQQTTALFKFNDDLRAERDRLIQAATKVCDALDTMQGNMPFGGDLAGAHSELRALTTGAG
jgi:uncharacterized coiled-coil DUF342 family protein